MSKLSYYPYIHFFADAQNIVRNIKLWKESKFPILFITGLAGSGKTYLADKLAIENKVDLLSLDSLKFYKDANALNKELVNEFLLLYPEIIPFIQCKWTDMNNKKVDQLYSMYSAKFVEYMVQKAYNEKKRYIIEGIHIYMRLSPDITQNAPLIIIGTSYFHSICRKFKREYLLGNNEYRKQSFKEMLFDLFKYEFKQLHILNKYIISLPKTRI